MEETREKSTKSTKKATFAENKWSVFENLQYRIPKYAITRKGSNQRKHPGNKLDVEKNKKSERKPFQKANFVRKLTKMEDATEKSTKTTTFGETSTKNKWSNFKNSQHLKAGKIKKSEPKPFQKAENKLRNSELRTEKETIELKKKDMIKVCLFSFHLSIF